MKKGSKHLKISTDKMSIQRKGIHNSPNTEFKKGSKINLGKKFPGRGGRKKGSIPWNKGKPMFEIRGDKHPRWKGGTYETERKSIEKKIEYKLWHKVCLERDNFTCQNCKTSGGKLEVHHINNFAQYEDLRVAIDNGITLCNPCHTYFHSSYGRTNNTKEQLFEFLNQK
jgi:5-methylcytosine-specific restriction endonuclease McrA